MHLVKRPRKSSKESIESSEDPVDTDHIDQVAREWARREGRSDLAATVMATGLTQVARILAEKDAS